MNHYDWPVQTVVMMQILTVFVIPSLLFHQLLSTVNLVVLMLVVVTPLGSVDTIAHDLKGQILADLDHHMIGYSPTPVCQL